MLSKIDFRYLAEKFVRDAAMVFVGSEVFRTVLDRSADVPSLEDFGAALISAIGIAFFRVVRDLGGVAKD